MKIKLQFQTKTYPIKYLLLKLFKMSYFIKKTEANVINHL